jgi:hypothetical protein
VPASVACKEMDIPEADEVTVSLLTLKLSASAMVPRKSTTLSKLLVPSVAL